jgi:hypothetical protein
MKMSSEIYQAIVKDETSRRILDICKTPRSSQEVKTDVFRYKRSEYPGSYDAISDVESLVGVRLGKLETLGALTFKDGKWQTTQTAIAILDKYFGR